MRPIAFALAKDQVVVAYDVAGAYKLAGFRRADGTKAWSIDLPSAPSAKDAAQPVMNRLAIDRAGRVLLALCDGSILCVGDEGRVIQGMPVGRA